MRVVFGTWPQGHIGRLGSYALIDPRNVVQTKKDVIASVNVLIQKSATLGTRDTG